MDPSEQGLPHLHHTVPYLRISATLHYTTYITLVICNSVTYSVLLYIQTYRSGRSFASAQHLVQCPKSVLCSAVAAAAAVAGKRRLRYGGGEVRLVSTALRAKDSVL